MLCLTRGNIRRGGHTTVGNFVNVGGKSHVSIKGTLIIKECSIVILKVDMAGDKPLVKIVSILSKHPGIHFYLLEVDLLELMDLKDFLAI